MTRWTEEQLAEYERRLQNRPRRQCIVDTSVRPFALPNNQAGAFAHGRPRRIPGTMNKLEVEYAAHLAERQAAKAILWFAFEAIKLRLAPATFYTPDFLVMPADCRLEAHEVKGFWEDDARVKIKCAAEIFPFRFLAVTRRAKKHGGGWVVEDFA